jgi:tripartite-type tricarboxylate transporter receptor subunit TctC
MKSSLRELSGGLRWICLFIAIVGAPGRSAAQSDTVAGWPDRPIRLILPTAAGGAGDISSRLVAQKLSERLGQQVIVENRAGASGVVGSVAVARAAPDGYTIGQVSASTHAASSVLTRNLPYDAVKDFAPISLIGTLPLVIAGYPGAAGGDDWRTRGVRQGQTQVARQRLGRNASLSLRLAVL